MMNPVERGLPGVIREADCGLILKPFAEGVFRPAINCAPPLAEAAAAHQRVEAGQTFGKIILTPAG